MVADTWPRGLYYKAVGVYPQLGTSTYSHRPAEALGGGFFGAILFPN
jgi:hypothetical protein